MSVNRLGRFLEKTETENRQEKPEKKPENWFFKTSFLRFSFMRPVPWIVWLAWIYFCQSTNSRRKQQASTIMKTKENCLNFSKIILKMYLKIETILISILKYDIQLIFARFSCFWFSAKPKNRFWKKPEFFRYTEKPPQPICKHDTELIITFKLLLSSASPFPSKIDFFIPFQTFSSFQTSKDDIE